ncbi:MAG: ABC transporter substrate-binding protein [Aquabacterium sp.]
MNRHRRLLLASALGLPSAAWPQPAARLPMVGMLLPSAPSACALGQPATPTPCYLLDELRVLGYVAGRNVTLEYRYARGDYSRLPALAAELVALRPDVLYTLTTPGANAAAGATATIPIVVGPAGEATLTRLAGNLARPVGNVTGQTLSVGASGEVGQKLLQLLKELAPRTTRVAVLSNPGNVSSAAEFERLGGAAVQLGITLLKVEASKPADLAQAFAAMTAGRADAIYVHDDTVLSRGEIRKAVIEWGLGRRMPVVTSNTTFAVDGALVTLGADYSTIARRAALYVHRILGGAKPGDLPVERPTVFKLSLNLKTAKALGIVVAPSMRLLANEVIE